MSGPDGRRRGRLPLRSRPSEQPPDRPTPEFEVVGRRAGRARRGSDAALPGREPTEPPAGGST